MKNYIVLFIILLGLSVLSSCNRGIFESGEVYYRYRPKHPHFDIQKRKFIFNRLIDTNYLYEQAAYFPDENGVLIKHNIGFYSDGRCFMNPTGNDRKVVYNTTNSWQTSRYIGYYTTDSDKISIQYFEDSNLGIYIGNYVNRKGTINKDTIIISEVIALPWYRKKIRSDVYVKTQYHIKK